MRLRISGPLLMMVERWHARRGSRTLLELYRVVRREQQELTGKALYEAVVIRRTGLDTGAARAILRRAEESFIDWPTERDLRFRDVVLFMVVDNYLRSHPARHGVEAQMGYVVARVIPKDL